MHIMSPFWLPCEGARNDVKFEQCVVWYCAYIVDKHAPIVESAVVDVVVVVVEAVELVSEEVAIEAKELIDDKVLVEDAVLEDCVESQHTDIGPVQSLTIQISSQTANNVTDSTLSVPSPSIPDTFKNPRRSNVVYASTSALQRNPSNDTMYASVNVSSASRRSSTCVKPMQSQRFEALRFDSKIDIEIEEKVEEVYTDIQEAIVIPEEDRVQLDTDLGLVVDAISVEVNDEECYESKRINVTYAGQSDIKDGAEEFPAFDTFFESPEVESVAYIDLYPRKDVEAVERAVESDNVDFNLVETEEQRGNTGSIYRSSHTHQSIQSSYQSTIQSPRPVSCNQFAAINIACEVELSDSDNDDMATSGWNDSDEESFVASQQLWQDSLSIDTCDRLPTSTSSSRPPSSFFEIKVNTTPTRRPILSSSPRKSPRDSKADAEAAIQDKRRENELAQKVILVRKKAQDRERVAAVERSAKKSNKDSPIKIQSNKQLIRNALMHVCLAGAVNEATKIAVLQGLYSYTPELEQVLKVYAGSVGPDVLDAGKVIEFYKYDSGSRTFKGVSTRSFGRTVHACAISNEGVRGLKKVTRPFDT